jgi:murein DD-endopeptidase MepM/ murein hydrolase activator NlpD
MGRVRRLVPGVMAVVLIAATGGCGPTRHGPANASPGSVRSPSAGAQPSPAGPEPTATPDPAATPNPTVRADLPHVFPVAGHADYGRTHHDYPATDIFADCGTRVRAVVDGVVDEVTRVDRFDLKKPLGADKGGLSVSIRGDDGVRYYGAHLSAVEPGVNPGVRVKSGDPLGKVGRTGNASNVCHLHFGLSPQCPGGGDWWNRRGVVYPWRYLDSWRDGGNLSPVDEIAGWQRGHGCPTSPPGGER